MQLCSQALSSHAFSGGSANDLHYRVYSMSQSSKPCVLIPSYDGSMLLKAALPHILSCSGAGVVSVIDDASTDDTPEMLSREFPQVNTIIRKTNGGFSAAVNDGIRSTASDLIVLLNNDVEVTPGFLDPILPLFDDEQVFSVSPSIILPKWGNLDEGCKTGSWHHGIFYTSQLQGISGIRPVLYTTGCAAVYRRSMLEELGGFDEAYSPFYWEDTDLGYRAWKRGWKNLYQPASVVYHQHSASISRIKSSYTVRTRARNSLLFVWRNVEDAAILNAHKRWLPLVLAKRVFARDTAFLCGWRDAFLRRREATVARSADSLHRILSDREIFSRTGIGV